MLPLIRSRQGSHGEFLSLKGTPRSDRYLHPLKANNRRTATEVIVDRPRPMNPATIVGCDAKWQTGFDLA